MDDQRDPLTARFRLVCSYMQQKTTWAPIQSKTCLFVIISLTFDRGPGLKFKNLSFDNLTTVQNARK